MHTRVLIPAPASYHLGNLRRDAEAIRAIDVNEVDGTHCEADADAQECGALCIAFYFEDGTEATVAECQAIVDAHDPAPPPAPPTVEARVDALPDPTQDFEGFKTGLKELLGG